MSPLANPPATAVEHRSDLVLATDPDCDRVGVAVRDKDAVNASLLICEMFAYYRHKEKNSLVQALVEGLARYFDAWAKGFA